MKNYGIILTLFIGLGSFGSKAQTTKEAPLYYLIQLGAFDSHKQSDFEAIRSYAYVYDKEGTVYIGGFNTPEAAEVVLEKVKAKGYADAFIADRKVADSKKVYVVQIATRGAGEPIDWASYSKAGDLYTLPLDKQVRVVEGIYEDVNDARVRLKEIQDKGFPDAFVKTVREVTLNPVTDFDKSVVSVLGSKGVKEKKKSVASAFSAVSANPGLSAKSKTAVRLQAALKEIGAYKAPIDGKAGKLTEQAYATALEKNRRLKRYEDEASKVTGFDGWEEARLLLTITRDLNVKEETADLSGDLFLNLPSSPLALADQKTIVEWNALLMKGMDAWSTKSQYNDQIVGAFKVAYLRTQLKLENYYTSKGLTEAHANGLAILVLKTLVSEDLEGYY